MLKAYAVALVLSSSTPVASDTQETVRPAEKQTADAKNEFYPQRPHDCCNIPRK